MVLHPSPSMRGKPRPFSNGDRIRRDTARVKRAHHQAWLRLEASVAAGEVSAADAAVKHSRMLAARDARLTDVIFSAFAASAAPHNIIHEAA